MGRDKIRLIEIVCGVCVCLVVLFVLMPSMDGHGESPLRTPCTANLGQICKAMLVYSAGNENKFPTVPLGRGHIVGEDQTVDNIMLNAEENPFTDLAPDGNRSISQNLWLLVRDNYIQPELVLCPGVRKQPKINMSERDQRTGKIGPKCYVDFQWKKPDGTISYSFVQPWSKFTNGHSTAKTWHADLDSRVVIGADANNGSQPDFKADSLPLRYKDMKQFVNSTNHSGDGQNVLYGDGHARFEKSAYVGINGDNIYTALPADYTGKPGDTAGILSVRPRDPFDPKINKPDEWDTVLIPARDADLDKWNRKP
jgi:hypothetical protein